MARRKRTYTEEQPLLTVSPEEPTSTFELERYVLGTLLADPGALSVVTEHIEPKHFSSSAHSTIFETMLKMDDKHIPIDVVPLIEQLRNDHMLEAVGDAAYVTSLIEKTVYTEHLAAYCKMIHDKWILRSLAMMADEMKHGVVQPGVEADQMLNDYTAKMFELFRGDASSGFRILRDYLNPVHEKIQDYRRREGHLVGVTTGFDKLDEMTGGFQSGELIILAARPSVGKTSLALKMALKAGAQESGKKVGFISLEMSAEQLVLRMLAMEARLELHHVRTGRLKTDEYAQLQDASERLYPFPIYIDDRSDQGMNEIRAKVRRLKKERGIDILYLDYLGLLRQPSDAESVQVAVSSFTRSLKALSKELHIPIVVLAQLSRAAVDKEKSEKRPQLHHLRDSGSIEQDADVVLMLYREFYDKGKAQEDLSEAERQKMNSAEIIVAKQRNGPVGTVNVTFKPEYASFEEIAFTQDNPF